MKTAKKVFQDLITYWWRILGLSVVLAALTAEPALPGSIWWTRLSVFIAVWLLAILAFYHKETKE